MGEIVPTGLLAEMRRLLELAGTDEQAAAAGFETLRQRYGRDDVATGVLAVTSEFVTATGTTGAAGTVLTGRA